MVNCRWLMAVAVLLAGTVRAGDLGQRVLIVWNEQEPEGKTLAEYYAAQRGVPTNQICRINVRVAETITRREFNTAVRDPLAKFLTEHGLWKQLTRSAPGLSLSEPPRVETVENQIWYVVLLYGVPLRIERDATLQEAVTEKLPPAMRHNEASVESELAVLPTPGLPADGPLLNPFFEKGDGVFDEALGRQMLLVGRLDGPDAATVKRMIDDAVAVEKTGLRGKAYFDIRSITEQGYVAGDQWIRGAAAACRAAGWECVVDEKPETLPDNFPMPDAALYAGWYAGTANGPFRQKDFRFVPGAVAYHIHSASGASVRTRTAYWVGPLLAKGAAATMGNVYEPYLAMTPHVEVFFKNLLAGRTFLEAGYSSQPVLSWQTTFVGDPLYRPFAAKGKQ